MEYVWWQQCFVTLFKGISWSLPIWSIFLAGAWFMSFVTRETVEKAIKKYTPKED